VADVDAVALGAPAAPDAGLSAYVRRSLTNTAVGLVLLTAVLGVIGIVYEDDLMALTRWVHRTIGVPGLLTILFVSDSFITPVPPDFILIVIAKSDLRHHWFPLVFTIGVLSVIAGNLARALGSRLGDTPWVQRTVARFLEQDRRLVARYGKIGVVLGAVTPIPFSVTCWMAGILKMKGSEIFLPTLLRFPRFFSTTRRLRILTR
jgi:membrane protein YqaA with SNARE-associated domain